MGLGLDPGHPAARLKMGVDAPLLPERLAIQAGGHTFMHQKFRDVEANTTSPDHRHLVTHRLALQQHIQVAQDLGVVYPGNRRQPWRDARGEDDLVVPASHQLRHIHPRIQANLDMSGLQLALEVTQGLEELFLARHALGDVELATDLTGRIEQRHLVPALGRHGGRRQTGRPGADHGDFLHLGDRQVIQLGLVAGPRVDQAGRQLAAEGMVQAGLVAANAGIDFVGTPLRRLVDEIRVGEERPGHGNHVGIALGEDLLGHFRGVDPVGGDQRNTHRAAQLGRDLAERRARHLGGDGRNPRFVPADTGVDDGRAGLFDGLGQQDDFVPGAAAFHQVEHRQAEDDDEVRTHRLTHTPHDLHRQAHAVLVATAPAVGTVVGMGREELVDEVTFRTHDFDAVVLGILGQGRTGHEVGDLFLDAFLIQLLGLERVDRGLDRTRRHLFRTVGITPGMEDLQTDLAAGLMHRVGDDTMLVGFGLGGQLGRAGIHPALVVWRDTAGHHQTDAATGALGKVGRHALETAGLFLKAGVHRAHQGAVAQRGETQVERGQQVRVLGGGHRNSTTSKITECGKLFGPRQLYDWHIKDAPVPAQ